MRPTLARRCHARRRRDRRRWRQHQVEVGDVEERDSSQSISATRSAVMRMLPGLGSPWTTHRGRPVSYAHAARHRATPRPASRRGDLRPVSAYGRSVDDRQPGRCGQPCVSRCSWRSASATRRQSASVSAVASTGHHHQTVGEQPAVRRRDRHRHGQTFTVEVLEGSVSHARSASLLAPRRPTARCR